MKKTLFFSLIMVFFVVILGFFSSEKYLTDWYTKSLFYFNTFSFVLFIFALFKQESSSFQESCKNFFKFHWLAIVLSFITMTFAIFACKPDFRILPSETNFISDSQTLYEKKECYIVCSSLSKNIAEKENIRINIDKRPAFFPYLLSLMHCIFGYKASNVFVLNYLFGVLSLFFIYYFIQLLFGRFWGICGLWCLAAFPIFILYTNSAGADVFNMFCSLVLFVMIYKFIKQPNSDLAEILLLWIPIIGQSSYESIFSIFIAVALVLYILPKEEYSKLTFNVWIFPFLLLPIIWLFRITYYSSFNLLNNTESTFGFSYFFENLKQAFNFYLSGEEDFGIISVISILGIIGSILFILELVKNNYKSKYNLSIFSDSNYKLFWGCLIAFYVFHAIAKFSYCESDFTNVLISSQSVLFLPLLITMAIKLLVECNEKYGLKKSYCALAILFLIIFYWPYAGKNCGVKSNELYNEFKEIRNYLETNFPEKSEYTCISDKSELLVPLGYSSVSYKDDLINSSRPYYSNEYYNKKNIERITEYYNTRVYSFFILIQNIDINKGKPDFILPENFKEEILTEYQYFDNKLIRFSKITLM